jgi:hypothetical protein
LSGPGGTIGETLRRVWVGETLGQHNASAERTRVVPANNYAAGLTVGFQRESAGRLLADASAGTPQRFVWAYAVDPTIPDEPVVHPGPIVARIAGIHRLPVTDEVEAEIRQTVLARARGERAPARLDEHDILVRAKVAGLLALLDGRDQVTVEDWVLSLDVWRTSCAVRGAVPWRTSSASAARARLLVPSLSSMPSAAAQPFTHA